MDRKLEVVEFTNHLGIGGTEKTIYTFLKHLDRERFHATVVATSSDGERGWETAIQGLGVEVVIAGESGLAETLRNIKPDIFHIHRAGWPEQGPITTAKQAGVPVVIEHNVFGRVDNTPENAMIDSHIFVSYSCAWRYQMWLGKPLTGLGYQVLYNPVDMDEFDRSGLFIHRDFTAKSIGRLGRADDTKWDFTFLEALPLIAGEHPDVKFHVMGITPAVEGKIKQMGLESVLKVYPPTADPAKIMEFYADISVFTHFASMGETFGIVLAEAMAARLPVVTHYTPPFIDNAQTELVNDGYNGFVARTPEIYADAVCYFLSSPDSAKRVGENGYAKARSSYSAPGLTRGLENIFAQTAIWKNNL
ncbi:MAG: glycosyltransferase family 4 protein [Nitrospinae bacterium]|nr:glycosyltransferase family 4 protein [Nitrospinota bacterium]